MLWYNFHNMKRSKIIQVPMSEDLLKELDALSREQDRSRASLIREACAEYIANAEEAEKVRQYIEGYEKFPEDEEDAIWARIGEQELSRKLAGDEW
jgi:metal-responsive CopG/Arc/MetJ family transcriptional regulator